jgi:heat-inducible transcriptional repressor
MDTLTERERHVLELILLHYSQSAEPIGSRSIEKLMKNRLSSATIRNVMANLEEKGFIFKPHVVAGRIPTTKAFRYYVDSMLTLRQPGKKTIEAIDALHKPRYAHIERLMGDASRILARISQYTSIVVEPKVDTMMFKKLEFVKLSSHTVLIVFVTSSGMVHTRLVDTEEDFDADLLGSMKRYMNERFSGKPFYLLKDAIVEDMHKDRESVNVLLAKIRETLETIVHGEAERDVYIEGTSRMIAFPEFSDIDKLKELFQALERKEKLIRLLDQCLEGDGMNVIIGVESDIMEMRDMSVIASAYRLGERSYGILGVIGPVRMDYSKVIPIVNYTAKAVTDILSTM